MMPFVVEVSVSDPLWSEYFDAENPVPLKSSDTHNYLTLTLKVANPTPDPQAIPSFHLVDADGTEYDGFGPLNDKQDYMPHGVLMEGETGKGLQTCYAPNARKPLHILLRVGEATKTIDVP